MGLRRFASLVGVLALLWAALALATPALANGPTFVTICHAAGLDGTTKYVTLTLPPSALNGHFDNNGTPLAGHEDDTLGLCAEDTTTTTIQDTTTTEVPDDTTTTTVQETTTTTTPEATTTSVTSMDSTTTTTDVGVTTTTRFDKAAPPPKVRTELPYTGIDPTFLVGLAAALGSSGAYILRKTR